MRKRNTNLTKLPYCLSECESTGRARRKQHNRSDDWFREQRNTSKFLKGTSEQGLPPPHPPGRDSLTLLRNHPPPVKLHGDSIQRFLFWSSCYADRMTCETYGQKPLKQSLTVPLDGPLHLNFRWHWCVFNNQNVLLEMRDTLKWINK